MNIKIRFFIQWFLGIILIYIALIQNVFCMQFIYHAFMYKNRKILYLSENNSKAFDINDNDQTVGFIINNNENRKIGVLWDKNIKNSLGDLGGMFAEARAINNLGSVVGKSSNKEGKYRAFVWEKGFMTELPSLSGGISDKEFCEAFDINIKGKIIGGCLDSHGKGKVAVIWENQYVKKLETLDGTLSSCAFGINDYGKIVGNYIPMRGGGYRACMWENGKIRKLEISGSRVYAYDINNSGQIVGERVENIKASPRAYLYENGKITNLHPKGWHESRALKINDNSEIIGYGTDKNGRIQSFLWRKDQISILDLPGGDNRVYSINNNGHIVGVSYETDITGRPLIRTEIKKIE